MYIAKIESITKIDRQKISAILGVPERDIHESGLSATVVFSARDDEDAADKGKLIFADNNIDDISVDKCIFAGSRKDDEW